MPFLVRRELVIESHQRSVVLRESTGEVEAAEIDLIAAWVLAPACVWGVLPGRVRSVGCLRDQSVSSTLPTHGSIVDSEYLIFSDYFGFFLITSSRNIATGGEVQRMVRGWRGESRGGVWRQAMLGLVLGLCVQAVLGAPTAAMQPSDSGGELGCARPLVDVVWGFLLTLLALSIAMWSAWQDSWGDKSGKIYALFVAIIIPISHIFQIIKNTCKFVALVWHCHKMEYGRMSFKHFCLILRPLSKSPLRILASCSIIIYVQKRVPSSEEFNDGFRQIEESWIWKDVEVEDESGGLVVGEDGARNTRSMNYERKELSEDGKLALIWGEYFSSEREQNSFLPKYNELKYLRGNSGFAVIAIAIQALGYIYAITFRSVKELKVAPIEVIGLVFNILLLIGASLHSTSNMCVRPLIIYMNDEREEKFTRILESRPRTNFDMKYHLVERFSYIGLGIIVLFTCVPTLIYFIISLKKSANIMVVVPLVIFGVGLLLSLLGFYFGDSDKNGNLGALLLGLIISANMVAYVWTMIVTFRHWKSYHYNTRPELLDWSQVIPFIG